MSERMIEMKKAQLLGQAKVGQTSQQVAATTVYQEDERLKKFLKRLARRDDSNPLTTSGPTVPTALSRRLLQRQGVGYLDDSVAALTSAAADRFLATVLQQGITCRERRCKGINLAKQEAVRRRNHQLLYQQDADDRKRRKILKVERKMKSNLEAIAAANELKKKGSGEAATANANAEKATNSKKRKAGDQGNGALSKLASEDEEQDDDGLDDDSLDAEERYYDEYYGDIGEDEEEEEEEEENESDFMLLLRDLERPLEAWNFKLTGKIGLGAIPLETSKSGEQDDEAEEEDELEDEEEEMENGDTNGDRSSNKSPKPDGEGTSEPSRSVAPMINSAPTAPPRAAAATSMTSSSNKY